jgi:hypothetical protein
MKTAKLIEVIETVSLRGNGSKSEPIREVTQYWSKDGQLLAEKDTITSDCFDHFGGVTVTTNV